MNPLKNFMKHMKTGKIEFEFAVVVILIMIVVGFSVGMYNKYMDGDPDVDSDAKKLASMGKGKWCDFQRRQYWWTRSPLYSRVC